MDWENEFKNYILNWAKAESRFEGFPYNERFYEQLRSLITSYALITGFEPDTHDGDRFIKEVYESLHEPEIEYEQFSLNMWALCC